MTPQNFKNHTRMVPMYHYVTFTLLLAVLIGAIVNLVNAASGNLYSAALLVVLTIAVVFITFFARSFALKAQDRAIRAEENLRHFALTGKLLDSRLRTSQIIALRFAPDEEFVALAKKAVDENLDSKTIKQAIQNWKGDYHRV
jgi:FtsH-binding integral membrane protein